MANYKKLEQLIIDNKAELCRKIEGLTLPSDAEKIKRYCISFFEEITGKDAEYMKQLSLLEQDLLTPVINIINSLYSSDIELIKKLNLELSEEKRKINNESQPTSKRFIPKEYGPALAGAAGGTLVATICKPSAWGVILLGSVISAIVGKVLYSLYLDKNKNVIAEVGDVKFPEYRLTQWDVNNIIINALVSAAEGIDKVLLTYRQHITILQDEYSHKMASFDLDKKFLGVLECYQIVLGNLASMEDSPIVKDTIKQVNNSLISQGYKAVHYSSELENLFEVKNGDCAEIEEFKPAIVKTIDEKESLILKGGVVLPQK